MTDQLRPDPDLEASLRLREMRDLRVIEEAKSAWAPESGLVSLVIGSYVRALDGRGGGWPPAADTEYARFLGLGLELFFDRLPARVRWWRAQQERATIRHRLGWWWFQRHIEAHEFLL